MAKIRKLVHYDVDDKIEGKTVTLQKRIEVSEREQLELLLRKYGK